MSKTVVVYHSGYGHTQRVAQVVAEGAHAQLVAIDADGNISEADWQALDAAQAIILGSPTYMGNVSWQFKKFADASSKRWFTRAWQDKFFGGFSVSASQWRQGHDPGLHANTGFATRWSVGELGLGTGQCVGFNPQRHQQLGRLSGAVGASALRRRCRQDSARRLGHRTFLRCARGGCGGQARLKHSLRVFVRAHALASTHEDLATPPLGRLGRFGVFSGHLVGLCAICQARG